MKKGKLNSFSFARSKLVLSLISFTMLTNFSYANQGKIETLFDNKKEKILLPYEDNYFLYSFSNRNFYNNKDMKKDEVKFKISVAVPIWKGVIGDNSLLGFSYTQHSYFQLSNSEKSRPFRETNYEPQLFLGWKTNYQLPFDWQLSEVETGVNHLSNGRDNDEKKSLSINRAYVRTSFEKENWLIDLKTYMPINQKEDKERRINGKITNYIGFFDLTVGYKLSNEQSIKVLSRYNWKTSRGAFEVSYHHKLSKYISFYTQYYQGYGESLIDYDRNIKRFGIGLSLNNIF